jgi:hypothetical protein
VVTPFPGTEVWKYTQKRGLVSDDIGWSRLNVNFNANFGNVVILSDALSRKELIALYKKFKMLRIFRDAKNVWFTPQLADLLRILIRSFADFKIRPQNF